MNLSGCDWELTEDALRQEAQGVRAELIQKKTSGGGPDREVLTLGKEVGNTKRIELPQKCLWVKRTPEP